ncbi:MAG TPA: sigma-54 dependent transcriptional regulator [Kofleriaceae bacterium]|nr:sigma-54 dependent transcriptional regulator [Kofleriaceae bacterium]
MSEEPRAPVLIIDDDAELARALGRVLSGQFSSTAITDPFEALATVAADPDQFDVILLDVNMPKMSGLDVLARLREDARSPAVIMLTADNAAATAATALRAGAFHYLTKPVRPLELSAVVEAAARFTELSRRSRRLEKQVAESTGGGVELVGRAVEMRRVLAAVEKLAQTDVGILVLGESGTGKEVVARSIHRASPRRAKPFVALNCGAIPESLIDSELFGHAKGAFTGAATARPGVFVEADGGTLFLDEIGDMPLGVQARLLRVLQDHEVRPVGGQGVRAIDVRVIAATHVDLQHAVDEGRFRTDLYYRLNVVTLTLPALRERKDDLPLLAAHFLRKHGGDPPPRLSAAAFEALVAYNWPGNVRELENTIMGALALRAGDSIETSALPARILEAARPAAQPGAAPSIDTDQVLAEAKRRAMIDFERAYLTRVLDQTKGNVAEAARRTGVDRSNFRRLLHRHGITAEDFRETQGIG